MVKGSARACGDGQLTGDQSTDHSTERLKEADVTSGLSTQRKKSVSQNMMMKKAGRCFPSHRGVSFTQRSGKQEIMPTKGAFSHTTKVFTVTSVPNPKS